MTSHKDFLDLAIRLKNDIQPPTHSLFRVFSIITYTLHYSQPSSSDQELKYITGTNGETCFIGGSICAERCALMKLRESHLKTKFETTESASNEWESFGGVQIKTIYVVADNPDPISPGLLCREFLLEVASENAVVVMCGDSSRSRENPLIVKLGELYPFWPLFVRIPANKIKGYAKDFSSRCQKPQGLFAESWIQLYEKALEETNKDTKDHLHPVRLASAVLLSNGKIKVAHQHKALEYGSTLDPVSKLSLVFDKCNSSIKPVSLVQIDQFGIMHAPFASARAFLVEHGFSDLTVMIHDREGKIHTPRLIDLVPFRPDLDTTLQAICK
jgi:cytidine deaminase